ncbi:MAG: hypothetical protein ACRDHF_05485 [Tepidiformaceae bacterium]
MKWKLAPASYVAAAILVLAAAGIALWGWYDGGSTAQEHPAVPQLIEALEPELNDEQAALLADGALTLTEYEGAIERVAACVEAKGLTVTRLPGEGVGGSTSLRVSNDGSIPLETGAAWHAECREAHTGKLGIVWAETNRGEFEQALAREDECLAAKGADHLVGRAFFRLTPDEWEARGWGPGSFEFWAAFVCAGVAEWETPYDSRAAVDPEKHME